MTAERENDAAKSFSYTLGKSLLHTSCYFFKSFDQAQPAITHPVHGSRITAYWSEKHLEKALEGHSVVVA